MRRSIKIMFFVGILVLSSSSCSEDIVLQSTIFDKGVEAVELPIEETCKKLPNSTPNTNFTMQTENEEFYLQGEEYIVTMYSSVYSFGQGNVRLFKNNTLIYSYGDYLSFSNNTRAFILPKNLVTSQCYNMRVTKGGLQNTDQLWVSPYFEIRNQ